MPIRSIAGADAQYYLLSFDEDGRERPDGAANTALKPTCMCDWGDSRRRNEPSRGDSRLP